MPKQQSNLIKRDTKIPDEDEISKVLDQKYADVNRNLNFLRPRRENLKSSIENFEKTLEASKKFIEDIQQQLDIDDETSKLIEKNIHDLSIEMKAIDNDIISILETSNLIDNSVHKRIRHKRDLDVMNVSCVKFMFLHCFHSISNNICLFLFKLIQFRLYLVNLLLVLLDSRSVFA